MCSPQRTAQDQEALWVGLLDGTVSLVSDHAPYRFDETGKLAAGPDPDFSQIANGLPGLETRLPLLFNAMVTQGRGGPLAFAEVTAQTPARLYGLSGKGAIVTGMDADLVVWNPETERTYGTNDLHDNVGYNPWAGARAAGPSTCCCASRARWPAVTSRATAEAALAGSTWKSAAAPVSETAPAREAAADERAFPAPNHSSSSTPTPASR